jgi:formate dehydrogenase assembly factor FdhD
MVATPDDLDFAVGCTERIIGGATDLGHQTMVSVPDGVIVLSSRISIERAQESRNHGRAAIVVAVSAPTVLPSALQAQLALP